MMEDRQLTLFSGLTLDDAARPTVAHLRIAEQREELIKQYLEFCKIEKENGGKKITVDSFLKDIDPSGLISKSTFYNWLRDYREGGFDALIPLYKCRRPKVSRAEDRCLRELLIDRINIGQAIFITKYFLKRRRTESPSSPATLRRWAKRLKGDIIAPQRR